MYKEPTENRVRRIARNYITEHTHTNQRMQDTHSKQLHRTKLNSPARCNLSTSKDWIEWYSSSVYSLMIQQGNKTYVNCLINLATLFICLFIRKRFPNGSDCALTVWLISIQLVATSRDAGIRHCNSPFFSSMRCACRWKAFSLRCQTMLMKDLFQKERIQYFPNVNGIYSNP